MSCDCNPIVVGEAGPQGSQGLAGINGTNGTNGVNAYTTTTASYTQPSVNSAVNITLANTNWIAVGQYIYIQAAGYYLVNTVPTSTSINATLKIYETAPASTITSNKKVTPSGNVTFNGSGASLTITGASSFNTSGGANNTIIATDNDASAVYVSGSNDRVGIGTAGPDTKLHVIGDVKIGNSTTDGNLIVTRATTLNSKNLASVVPLDIIGSTSSTHLLYAESTSDTVVIGSATPTSGKKLKVVGATRMEGTLETTGAATLASLTVSGATSTGSIAASTITASGAVSGLSYQTATGSGAAKLTKFFYYTPADITLSSLADGAISSTEYTTSITGVLTTDFVQVSAQSSITDFYTKCIVSAAVSDTTKIAVTILNKTGGAISGTVSIKLLVTRAAAS